MQPLQGFLVDQDSYGLLVRYIHLNPIRSKLVSQAKTYAWSCHRVYLGEQALSWLTSDWVLGKFGHTLRLTRQRFAQFVEDKRIDGHQDFLGSRVIARF